jgi:hypothetical protein
MLKLYKRVNGILNYWETWDKDDKSGVVHWGVVGEKGQSKTVITGLFNAFRKKIQKEIDQQLEKDYQKIDIDDHDILLIEYSVDDMGSETDLKKRHKLQELMDDVLGWTGLGYCDGGSIGSGTMEVCCYVVDFEIAKNVVARSLENTDFANFTRIFKETIE